MIFIVSQLALVYLRPYVQRTTFNVHSHFFFIVEAFFKIFWPIVPLNINDIQKINSTVKTATSEGLSRPENNDKKEGTLHSPDLRSRSLTIKSSLVPCIRLLRGDTVSVLKALATGYTNVLLGEGPLGVRSGESPLVVRSDIVWHRSEWVRFPVTD